MRIVHWQDIVSLAVGVWLLLSPLALGFAGAPAWITVVLGMAVIMFAIEGLILPSFLEEWGEIVLGLSLVAAPWALGYQSGDAIVNSVASGVLVMVMAVWEMTTDGEFAAWWHEHTHQPSA